ncbi:MAG: phage late control D family protein [bacterium]
MDFVDSSKLNRNFYVPAFAIKVGKNDLLDKRVEVFGVTVNNTLEGADDFSFTVNNPFNASRTEFKYLENKFFDVGKEVKIKVGYGDRSKLPTILHGIITSLDVSFPSNGISQLTVKGFDFSHKMMKGKDSKTWGSDNRPIKYSDIVKEIATRPEYGFKVSNVENTLEEHPQVKQKNESDYDFIKKKLANEISYEVFVIGKDFYFRPRANTKSEVVTTLQWGQTLISFTPEINTADQVNEVEVRGWNPARQKAIVGKASQGQEQGRDGGRKTGSDVMASIQKQVINHVWQPVFSKKEADDIAKSILEKTALEFVKGNGECIGLPGIMPGKNIELRGLGETFSKIYYIEKATHTVSTSGYKTTFSVKENSI